MIRHTLWMVAVLLMLGGGPAWGQDGSRGMVPEDYYRFQFVSDPQLSPDGRLVAFVRSEVSDDRRSRSSSIWIVPTDGSEPPRAFTRGPSDRAPRWSPDGAQLAFVRSGDDGSQVYAMYRRGGEARPVTAVGTDTSLAGFQWAPDGAALLLTLRTRPEAVPMDSAEGPTPDVVAVEQARYKRNGSGYLDDKRAHLWMFDLAEDSLTRLTSGAAWNDSNPSFSPDGRRIVFDSNRTGEEYEGNPNDDLWVVPVTGGEAQPLTLHPHRDASPVWSPDGAQIAYIRTEESYDQPDIWLVAPDGGEPQRLTGEFDRIPRGVQWAPGGRALYFTADDEGAHRLFRLDLASRTVRPMLTQHVTVGDVDLAADGDLLVFTLEDERRLPEVYAMQADGTNLRPLTRLNASVLDSLALQPVEPMTFENEDGMTVQGFLVRPVGWEAGRRYPFVLNIKGGPGGMWGHAWFHEFQMLAAAGYAVGFVNYRGSTGYGIDHQQAVRLDYGGADYRDNMQFVDALLAAHDWIDPERLVVTGGSHGGFLTNWIVTQTDRFQAAVTQRSVSNWVSEAGTQEYTPRQMREEFGGTLWTNYDLYWDRSPLKYADRVTTPTLIIHSDQDLICPIGQAQEWFYALKVNGVPTELVVFEGENHSLSRTGTPVNLVERLRRILGWFEQYVPPGGAP